MKNWSVHVRVHACSMKKRLCGNIHVHVHVHVDGRISWKEEIINVHVDIVSPFITKRLLYILKGKLVLVMYFASVSLVYL